MVRLFLVSAALASAIGLAQAAVPHSQPAETAAQPAPTQRYVVFFEAGKANLTPEAREILHSAAQQVHAMPQAKVRVMLPASAKNTTALLQSRARALKTELVRDGVQSRSIGNSDNRKDSGFANSDPMFRTWLDRSATVEILPLPDADSDGQVG